MSDRKLTPIAKALVTAKRRIEDPKNWCRAEFVSRTGQRCALGAVGYSYTGGMPPAVVALYNSAERLFGLGVMGVNHTKGHAAVMQMYDHAIARALSEGK